MSVFRWSTLTFGPLLLVGLCYVLTRPVSGAPLTQRQVPSLPPQPPAISDVGTSSEAVALRYRTLLPRTWSLRVFPPFVLAGDLAVDDLEILYRETLAPTARALAIGYFDRVPSEPITVLVCSSTDSYRQCINCLRDGGREEYAGIYLRAERRLVVNLSTGEGTLAHELTHALAHVDFPKMPEWFDEGLASLHEESQFSDDGLRLIGAPNWRGELLREALRSRRLPSLAELLTQPFGRHVPALAYAQARYLCLFLQEKQLLGAYYRKCRAHIDVDPTGGWSLIAILGHDHLDAVDAEFQAWLATHFSKAPVMHH
uniref:DUF1570 domain-containing protein n=1 Tax=Schlesneria paludicola TaxID=360056 RepID=A0A7C4LNG3_9PLAN